MLTQDYADNLYEKYAAWFMQNGACKHEIMLGAKGAKLPEIKTGEVDMAGNEWPDLDPKKLYIGGYLENRIIGATDAGITPDEMRTLHIGLDLFKPAGAAVFAPLKGKIHSFKNNNGPRDYGPCIILQHDFGALSFYTLYGHLSINDLSGLEIGQIIEAGQEFAHLGDKNENGGWPAHLHFQIILDMLGKEGDFYGLCRPIEIESWKKLCPNPMEFLDIKSIWE